jgi:AraC family transcriptional regulator
VAEWALRHLRLRTDRTTLRTVIQIPLAAERQRQKPLFRTSVTQPAPLTVPLPRKPDAIHSNRTAGDSYGHQLRNHQHSIDSAPRQQVAVLVARAASLRLGAQADMEADDAIATAHALLSDALRHQQSRSSNVSPPTALMRWQTQRVRDYVEAQMGTTLTVVQLGRQVMLSKAHFARLFKRSFGMPPHAYILQRRIARACQQLQTTSLCLAEIALQCGFGDQAHLCKRFRERLGLTPSAWRRVHCHGPNTSIKHDRPPL